MLFGKTFGKGMEKALREIGNKTASLLPGIISSIVSLLFKTAGQAIGFLDLAEHTWLLILAVMAFLVDRYVRITISSGRISLSGGATQRVKRTAS